MKALKWLILAALALVSCAREEEVPAGTEQPFPEGKPVTLHFSVLGDPIETTKGLDNGGKMDNMYVAVFGSSGYLKQYEPATLVEAGTYSYDVVVREYLNGKKDYVTRTVPKYEFSVTLALSESPRKIHFVGNGPANIQFGYDSAIMPKLMSAGGEKAYWQMKELPNGIRAKKVDGVYVDADGNPIPDGGEGYIPDETTLAAFENIPLIRNWAKIALYAEDKATSYFEPYSYAVVNVPSSGAVAPYSGKTGFIQDYMNLGFDDLEKMGYSANLPAGVTFNYDIPSIEDFLNPAGSGGRVSLASTSDAETRDEDSGHAVFLYERPVPTEKLPPTYVIVYGHYFGAPDDLSNAGDYYYKVDLMETTKKGNDWESHYYPIYRNFKYQINIQQILSRGQDTPAAAAASAGSADVSTDINTSGLSDISDGVGRLFLQPWMAQTFTIEHNRNNPVEELSVCFYTDGEPDLESPVRVELLDPTDGGDPVIYQVPTDDPDNPEPFLSAPSETPGDGYGWRQIRFCTIAPGRVTRTQTMRIIGTHAFGRLYRDVVISVQPLQPMWVRCGQEELSPAIDVPQTVTFGIPDGLVKSMFPLEFTIEAQDMTLTPDKSHSEITLPLVCATSISLDDDYKDKPAFQFKRTVTWEEYLSLPTEDDEDENIWRVVDNYFRTNSEQNATKVWVYNKYFRDKDSQDLTNNNPMPVSASFGNFEYKQFTNLAYPCSIPRAADKTITFHFDVYRASNGKYPQVTLKTRGLVSDSPLLTPGDELGTYLCTPADNSGGSIDLEFITTTNDGDIEVALSSPEFYPASLEPYRFNKNMPAGSYGLLDGLKGSVYSNVAYGRVQKAKNDGTYDGRDVIFGFYADPNDLSNPTVTISDLSGNILTNDAKSNTSGLKANNPSSYPVSNPSSKIAGATPKYYEFFLKTVGARVNQNVSFQLTAQGYVTEVYDYERLTSKTRLHSCDVTGSLLRDWYNADSRTITSLTHPISTDESYFQVTIECLDGAPAPIMDGTSALVFGKTSDTPVTYPGGRYRLTFVSGNVTLPFTKVYECENQRFFWCQFSIDPQYRPASITVEQGHWYNYAGDNKKITWVPYEDADEEFELSKTQTASEAPSKSIVFEVESGKTVRISSIFYKAISHYGL